MWETFFVCKPVCQWLDIRVSFSDGPLKTEIAYNTPIFMAVTRNHGSGQKLRYTAKITVIMAIVNAL